MFGNAVRSQGGRGVHQDAGVALERVAGKHRHAVPPFPIKARLRCIAPGWNFAAEACANCAPPVVSCIKGHKQWLWWGLKRRLRLDIATAFMAAMNWPACATRTRGSHIVLAVPRSIWK